MRKRRRRRRTEDEFLCGGHHVEREGEFILVSLSLQPADDVGHVQHDDLTGWQFDCYDR